MPLTYCLLRLLFLSCGGLAFETLMEIWDTSKGLSVNLPVDQFISFEHTEHCPNYIAVDFPQKSFRKSPAGTFGSWLPSLCSSLHPRTTSAPWPLWPHTHIHTGPRSLGMAGSSAWVGHSQSATIFEEVSPWPGEFESRFCFFLQLPLGWLMDGEGKLGWKRVTASAVLFLPHTAIIRNLCVTYSGCLTAVWRELIPSQVAKTPEKTQTQTNPLETLRNFMAFYCESKMTWPEIRDVFNKAEKYLNN